MITRWPLTREEVNAVCGFESTSNTESNRNHRGACRQSEPSQNRRDRGDLQQRDKGMYNARIRDLVLIRWQLETAFWDMGQAGAVPAAN